MADAENIDGTTGETGPYNTKIPALAENANIQEALRVYHYGTKTPPANMGAVISNSVAGHFKNMSTRVTSLETQGIGSTYSSSQPTPENLSQPAIPDGFIWVDANSAAPNFNIDGLIPVAVAKYQTTTPTGTIAEGSLWIDKGSDPLTMYVYDGTVGWKQIGGDMS
jgi:hypothetical protein